MISIFARRVRDGGETGAGPRGLSKWTLLLCFCLVTLLVPGGLNAQTGSAGAAPSGGGASTASAPVSTYGSTNPTPLEFLGGGPAANVITLSTGVSTQYDDNIFSSNLDRVRDEELSLTGHVGITRTTQGMTLDLQYTPFYQLYRQYTAFDHVNHAATFKTDFRLSPQWTLSLHDAFSYMNGAYPTVGAQPIPAGPPSPTALNTSISVPTTRNLNNTPGIDLKFVPGRRSSLTFSGGYVQQKFSTAAASSAASLYNTTGFNGGFHYEYRVTEHSTFGVNLLYQDSTYQGGQLFGGKVRTQVASPTVSWATQLSPTVTVSLFGGPQYVKTLGMISVAGVPSRIAAQIEPSGGGSVTKEVRKTALSFTAARAVTSGGGLYTSIVNDSLSLGARRRLVGRWEASLTASAARGDTSLLKLKGETDSAIGTFTLTRTLGRGSTFHISYATMHQLSSGSLPTTANLDRNQISVGFDYQFAAIPLGR